jgi:hypothetical protein
MREKKLSQLAGNTNYATAPFTGQPTKIAPPSQHITDGKVPGLAFGAQWQNYIEYYLQKQIERSAVLPHRNWQDVSSVLPATTSTPRFAHNRKAGFTMVANGVNNSVKYYQELLDPQGGSAPLGVTLAPASGTFVPKCVVAFEDPISNQYAFFVGGSNSTATTKTLWRINQNATTTEIAAPTGGSIEVLAMDPETLEVFGFIADANRSMCKLDTAANTLSSITQRSGAYQTPAVASTFAAAGNGRLIHAFTPGGGFVQWEYTNTGTISWNSREYSGGVDTSLVLDARYSPILGVYMVLTSNKLITFTDPAGTVTTTAHTGYAGGAITLEGGCLTDTGWVGYNDGDGANLFVVPYVGDTVYAAKYGGMGDTTGVFARYDGSAVWFMQDRGGTKKLFRTLRSY